MGINKQGINLIQRNIALLKQTIQYLYIKYLFLNLYFKGVSKISFLKYTGL